MSFWNRLLDTRLAAKREAFSIYFWILESTHSPESNSISIGWPNTKPISSLALVGSPVFNSRMLVVCMYVCMESMENSRGRLPRSVDCGGDLRTQIKSHLDFGANFNQHLSWCACAGSQSECSGFRIMSSDFYYYYYQGCKEKHIFCFSSSTQ